MIRRLSTALMGLAFILPLAAIPVAAHTPGALVIDVQATYTDAAGRHVVGTITNHFGARRGNIQVTASFQTAANAVIATETDPAYITSLAPHGVTPFHVLETAPLVGYDHVVVTTSSASTTTKPVGGLDINPGSLVGNVYTGTISNESATTVATGVVVYAVRKNGTVVTDTAASAVIPSLAINNGAPQNYVITFNAASTGTTVETFVAQTTTGSYLTSWNNYFGDLAITSFKGEIEYLADRGITLGCGAAVFCPTGLVTREQMALFLDRAIGLTDAGPAGFTDISTLSAESQQAINNLFAAGIAGGCSTSPLKFCPTTNVTRGQMSKFIVLGYELPDAAGDHFTDDTGHFSEVYNNAMFEASITTGCAANLYCPNNGVKREQMAKFIFEAENP